MTTKQMQTVAVFTGDLVGSTNLTKAQIDAAFAALEDCAKKAEEWTGHSLNFTRHRGDGWQVLLPEPKYLLRLAIAFRAAVKALGPEFDTYIGIATGEAGISIQSDLNSRTETVFIESGSVLEKIKEARSLSLRMAYYKPDPQNRASEAGAAVVLADKIVTEWTKTQAEAMTFKIGSVSEVVNYTDLAKTLKKSRQTVTKTLTAAGAEAIQTALDFWELAYD